jgi:hypothetical protein
LIEGRVGKEPQADNPTGISVIGSGRDVLAARADGDAGYFCSLSNGSAGQSELRTSSHSP